MRLEEFYQSLTFVEGRVNNCVPYRSMGSCSGIRNIEDSHYSNATSNLPRQTNRKTLIELTIRAELTTLYLFYGMSLHKPQPPTPFTAIDGEPMQQLPNFQISSSIYSSFCQMEITPVGRWNTHSSKRSSLSKPTPKSVASGVRTRTEAGV